MEVVRVICEWDFGQDAQMFATEGVARKWAKDVIAPEVEETLDELEEDGLLWFEAIKVIGEWN